MKWSNRIIYFICYISLATTAFSGQTQTKLLEPEQLDMSSISGSEVTPEQEIDNVLGTVDWFIPEKYNGYLPLVGSTAFRYWDGGKKKASEFFFKRGLKDFALIKATWFTFNKMSNYLTHNKTTAPYLRYPSCIKQRRWLHWPLKELVVPITATVIVSSIYEPIFKKVWDVGNNVFNLWKTDDASSKPSHVM